MVRRGAGCPPPNKQALHLVGSVFPFRSCAPWPAPVHEYCHVILVPRELDPGAMLGPEVGAGVSDTCDKSAGQARPAGPRAALSAAPHKCVNSPKT